MENNVKNVQKLKIILLGDSGVGKTSLINQYVQGKFQKKPILDFREPLSKELEVKSKQVILQIYDTGGRERQGDRGLEATFFNNAKACMLVYDVNDPHSLENLENWHNEFSTKVISSPSRSESFPFVVLGNKAETDGGREIYPEWATKWCQDKRIAHFLTSAKDNKRVAEAFQYVVELALNYETNQYSLNAHDPPATKPPTIKPSSISAYPPATTMPTPTNPKRAPSPPPSPDYPPPEKKGCQCTIL